MEGVKQRVLRGGLVKIGAQAASFVLRVGGLIVVARLLGPEDYGLVGMVGAVTGAFNVLRDAGLARATVQSKTINDAQLSTLFWINAGVGLALTVVFAALAPALASFYREPRLLWVTVSLGAGFLVNALGVQHTALLERDLRFSALSVIDVVALLVSLAVAVIMAYLGYGYWALVASSLVTQAASTIGAWLFVRWVPRRPARGAGVSSMVRFGGTVTLNSLLQYVSYNVDKVLLGRFAGADALGIYGRAYQLLTIPMATLNGAVGPIAFSALSRLQGDASRIRYYFLKGYSLVVAANAPVAVACALFADDIVLVALGPKWGQVAPLLRYLAPTTLVFALTSPLTWLMMADNLAGRSLKIAMGVTPLLILAYVLGLPHGAAGVAIAFSATMVVLALPVSMLSVWGSAVSMRDVVGAASRPLLSALMATAAALLARPLVSRIGFPAARLAVEGTLLFAVYAWALLLVMGQKEFYAGLLRSMREPPSDEKAP